MANFADDVCYILAKMELCDSHPEMVEPIRKKNGNHLYRIALAGSTYVLKVFIDPDASREVAAYAMLRDLGVPTLRVISSTNDALLLEDLDVSEHLRLACQEDIGNAEVGVALSIWYRALHGADWRGWTRQHGHSSFRREIDEITPVSILELASRVRGQYQSRWVTLADNIDRIRNAAITSAETLNYNDFHWTNLALSRNVKPIRAVVFDYHLLGLGLRYSDYRNVTGSLGPVAADAFRSAYGETDPGEKVLDDLMAPLCALVEAFRRPRFPTWAEESLELAKAGEIHGRFERVMEVL